MSTTTRPELSGSNQYYITKHRYYELKHFCLQYPNSKKVYSYIDNLTQNPDDITDDIERRHYIRCLKIVDKACMDTDPVIGPYILKAVTEGWSYDVLRARCNVPCCRDTYYELYRRFFWILNNLRD